MEIGAVKSGGRGGDMEAVPVPAHIINKRRRRERNPSSGVGCNNINQQVEREADQAAAATTATTVKRSSKYRGVSRHRWTGRYEAHLWDKGSRNPTLRKKGKQIYLGAYDEEESAARAYDLAALKYWGTSTSTNFPVSEYEKEIEIMKTATREGYLATLRRRSSGFSRGVSKYRGVARKAALLMHHHNGRWEARIGRVFGNKYLYLGTYGTQEEAAHAYDLAAIEYRGINALTNFDLSTYIRWLKPAAAGNSHNPVLQEPKPILEYSRPVTTLLSNHISTERHQITDLSIFKDSNPFPLQDLDIPNKGDSFQANIKSSPPFSPCTRSSSSSSPTALSLLLRSSVFEELVEKNLNNSAEVNTEANDAINNPRIGSKMEVEETLYDEIVINNRIQYTSFLQDVFYGLE